MYTKAVNILSALALFSTVFCAELGIAEEHKVSTEKQHQVDKPSSEEVGSTTRRLLDVQRQGTHASDSRQYVSGAEMQRIYHRYLETFEHPVPEFFIKNEFSAE